MIFIVVCALEMAGLTWVAGWWGVVLVALVNGYVRRAEAGTSWRIALAAVEGWSLLLLGDALVGPFGRVATTLGGAMRIPGPALLVATLLFAALLAWSAATIAVEVGLLVRTVPKG